VWFEIEFCSVFYLVGVYAGILYYFYGLQVASNRESFGGRTGVMGTLGVGGADKVAGQDNMNTGLLTDYSNSRDTKAVQE